METNEPTPLQKTVETLDESIVENRAAAIYYLHPSYEGNPFSTRTIVPWEKIHNKGMYLQIARFHLTSIQTALRTELLSVAKQLEAITKERDELLQENSELKNKL